MRVLSYSTIQMRLTALMALTVLTALMGLMDPPVLPPRAAQ